MLLLSHVLANKNLCDVFFQAATISQGLQGRGGELQTPQDLECTLVRTCFLRLKKTLKYS